MSSQGNLDLTELTVRAPALRLPELPPQAVTVRYQVAYAPQAKRLTATELDARVLQADGAERLRLRLTRPLQLSADGTVATPPGEELPEVQLDVNGMPLALVNAFLPADTAARIESGTLHGTLKATLQPDGKTLAVAGSLAEKDVRVALGTQPLDALSATHDINLTLANLRDLKIAEFATGFTLAQQPAGQIALLGDLNLQTLAGRQTVNLQAPSALLDFIGRLAGGYRVGQGAVVYAGTVTLASAGELAAQGELTLKGLTVNHPSRRLPALPPLDGTVRHQAAFNKERKLLILSELDARLAQGVAEMLRLELSRPVRVDLAHGVQVAAAEGGAVELQLALTNLPLALANPVIPAAKGIHFDSGTASGQLSLGLKADSKTLYAKGRLGEANLALTARDKTYGPATLTHDLDIEFADSAKLTLTTCTTDLLVGERPAGRIALSGTLDLKAGAGRQDLTVTGLSHEVLAALPLTLPDGITVQKLLLDARLEASQADGFKTVSANGQLTIPQVVAAHAETGTLPATKADCTFSGQYRPDGVRLDALTVRAEGDGTLLADLAAKGQLPLPLAAGQGRIDVTSQGANLEVVAGIAKVFAGGRKTAPREDKPAPADRPSTLNDLKLVGTLDAKALSFRNVLVSKAAGTVTLDKGVVTVKPLDLVVNESPVSLTATVDLGTPGYAYEVQGTVANLDLAPYLRSFAPPMVNSQVSGHIASVRTEFKGSGLTLARLSETLAGTAQVKGDSLVVRNVPAFDAFADEWELPELQRQSFDTVALDLRAADGLVSIQQGLVRGADLRLDAEGAMRVADLALDVLAKAAVGGALEKRLIQKGLGTGFVRFDETHRRLPTAIPITGTLLKPETRFDFGRLLKETAKSVGAGVLNQVLDDAAQGKKIDARSILEGVFKPASTEPETAPTPEATPQQPATPATPATPTTDKPSTTRPAGGLPGLILPRLAKPAETTPAPATPANKPADEPAPRPAPVIVIPKIR
ncbi:MAG: putative assembly protein [Lentisphaerae bacterium ADurb.BinA184]|nr:MAG: putative assembly protein [Lentisphaerae bacterium ADurb.BinA184]